MLIIIGLDCTGDRDAGGDYLDIRLFSEIQDLLRSDLGRIRDIRRILRSSSNGWQHWC